MEVRTSHTDPLPHGPPMSPSACLTACSKLQSSARMPMIQSCAKLLGMALWIVRGCDCGESAMQALNTDACVEYECMDREVKAVICHSTV